MAPLTTVRPSSLTSTPSKKVCPSSPLLSLSYPFCQAAAAIEAFSINSPTKPSKKATVKPTDCPHPEVVLATVKEQGSPDDLEVLRQKFVGEVDLPESMWHM